MANEAPQPPVDPETLTPKDMRGDAVQFDANGKVIKSLNGTYETTAAGMAPKTAEASAAGVPEIAGVPLTLDTAIAALGGAGVVAGTIALGVLTFIGLRFIIKKTA